MNMSDLSLNSKIWLIVLSLILLFPTFFCVSGIVTSLDLENPRRHEGLIVVGVMFMYSFFIWIPFLVTLIKSWGKHKVGFNLLVSTPFLIMLGCFLYSL